jgi:hypothetical protein
MKWGFDSINYKNQVQEKLWHDYRGGEQAGDILYTTSYTLLSLLPSLRGIISGITPHKKRKELK